MCKGEHEKGGGREDAAQNRSKRSWPRRPLRNSKRPPPRLVPRRAFPCFPCKQKAKSRRQETRPRKGPASTVASLACGKREAGEWSNSLPSPNAKSDADLSRQEGKGCAMDVHRKTCTGPKESARKGEGGGILTHGPSPPG
ncbi:UNVERIFIED_CONTAM: hypothetical protein K2H54_035196 [Gekko kuhli]